MIFQPPPPQPELPETLAEKAVSLPDKGVLKIREWRMFCLTKAGYDPDAASRIACDRNIDLHMACDLLTAGCDVQTALRILM